MCFLKLQIDYSTLQGVNWLILIIWAVSPKCSELALRESEMLTAGGGLAPKPHSQVNKTDSECADDLLEDIQMVIWKKITRYMPNLGSPVLRSIQLLLSEESPRKLPPFLEILNPLDHRIRTVLDRTLENLLDQREWFHINCCHQLLLNAIRNLVLVMPIALLNIINSNDIFFRSVSETW